MNVRILGLPYTVTLSPDLGRDRSHSGECVPSQMKIIIDSTTPIERQQETLVHEIFEALTYELQMDWPHEKLAAMASAWAAVLADNPTVFSLGAKE